MKERPILFSTAMVKAILEGRKVQTRRVVKANLSPCDHEGTLWRNEPMSLVFNNGYIYCKYCGNGVNYSNCFQGIKCPYGNPGDRLWVRETWAEIDFAPVDFGGAMQEETKKFYRADFGGEPVDWNWKPSIFMPRQAARIFLEITNIRVERVQDITRTDIRSEGLTCPKELCSDDIEYNYKKWYLDEWIKLWDSINAERGYGWDINPWVWVVEFKKL